MKQFDLSKAKTFDERRAERDRVRQEVRDRWRDVIIHYTQPAKSRVAGEVTYICPICRHGKGGDGLARNPKSKDGNGLKCFSCGFSGDVIDLIQQQKSVDFNTALTEAAAVLGLSLEASQGASERVSKPSEATQAVAGKNDAPVVKGAENAGKRRLQAAEDFLGKKTAATQYEEALADWIVEQEQKELEDETGLALAFWHAGKPVPKMLEDWLRKSVDDDFDSMQDLFEQNELISDGNLTVYGEYAIKAAEQNELFAGDPKPSADFTAYYDRCRANLNDPAALSYLQARGISPATAANLQTGYDPQADPANVPGAMGDEYRPHPEKRLIFPCTKDFYIPRSINPDTPPRYKAPMPKGSTAHLYNADALYSDADVVFVTEGVFDCLSIIEKGAAAVSLNSKGNGNLLVRQLEQKPTGATLVICFDNEPDEDEAAKTRATAEKLRSDLQAMGAKCIVYNVAGVEHDVNDLLKVDPSALEANIQAAQAAAAAVPEPADNSADEAETEPREVDYLTAFLDKIQTEAYKPYQTGLGFFDDLLNGGVIRQTLLLLLAAPGTGKTTLCAQIAEQMASRGKKVIYFNLEMSREQMTAKSISNRLARKGNPMPALKVMQGYSWTDAERDAVVAAVNEYREKVQPYLQYNPDGIAGDLDEIRDYLHRIGEQAKAAGEEAPAIVVDYLHLISSKAGLDAQELVKQAVKTLKDYAQQYDTFVIGIVATNRLSNTAGRVTLESGRDSSALEYTADYQLSLNYYEVDKGEVQPTEASRIAELQKKQWRRMIIRVLKSRFSMPGKSANVYFNAANNIFYGEHDFMPVDADREPFDHPTQTRKMMKVKS